MKKNVFNRFLGMMLTMAMCLSLCAPAFAEYKTDNQSYKNSSEVRIEIKTAFDQYGNPVKYTVFQFDKNDNLKYTVDVSIDTKILVVNDFTNEESPKRSILSADEIIEEKNVETSVVPSFALMASNSEYKLGRIDYKPVVEDPQIKKQIDVFCEELGWDYEAYTIKAKVGNTVAVLVAALAAFLSSKFGPEASGIAQQIIQKILEAIVGAEVDGVIKKAFSEEVAVKAFRFRISGKDVQSNRRTAPLSGVKRLVITKNTSYYNKCFYEGTTPNNWKTSSVASIFWNDLFSGYSYPGVKRYS